MESLPVVTVESIRKDYVDWSVGVARKLRSRGQYDVLERLYANESTLIQMLSAALRMPVPEDPERRKSLSVLIDHMTKDLIGVKVLALSSSQDLLAVQHLLNRNWKGSAMLLVKLDTNEEKQSYCEMEKYLNARGIPSRTHVERDDLSFLLHGFTPVVANVSSLPSAAATADDKGKGVVMTPPAGGSYFGGSPAYALRDGTFFLSQDQDLGGMLGGGGWTSVVGDVSGSNVEGLNFDDIGDGTFDGLIDDLKDLTADGIMFPATGGGGVGGSDLGGGTSGGGRGGGDLDAMDMSGGGGGLDLDAMDMSGRMVVELFDFQAVAKDDEREN